LGLWVGSEGVIYEFDDSVHVVEPFPIPRNWQRFRAIDFGYTNPFVCQWWAVDPDGRMYLYREIYMSQRTVREHARIINQMSTGERIIDTVADHDAEDRATLRENGIDTTAADKRVQVGIEKVQDRLRVQGDGKPRLMVLRDALLETDQSLADTFLPLSTADEFGSYIWEPQSDGKPNKEQPQKLYDHGMDALRYMVMRLDAQSKVATASGRTVSRKSVAGMFN
jgi:phage terminase large subunit